MSEILKDGTVGNGDPITIWEHYVKRGDIVYRRWSYDKKEWKEEITAYQNPPYIFVNWKNND